MFIIFLASDTEVYYTDSSNVPLDHLEMTIREVFLPLLSTNNLSLASAAGNGDKVMDILHRLMAAVEVTQGHVEVCDKGKIQK